jgi:hypothetical protein
MITPSRWEEIKESLAVIGAILATALLGLALGRMVATSEGDAGKLLVTSVSAVWITWSAWYWMRRVK